MRRLNIKKSAKVLALTSIVSLILIGCGGNGGNSDIEISHGPLDDFTKEYRCNMEDATIINAGELVRPLVKDTKLKIWHYQNSEEYACVLKGQAVVRRK